MDTSHAKGGARLRRDDLWALLVVGALVGDAIWLGWRAREPTLELEPPEPSGGSPSARSSPGTPKVSGGRLGDSAPNSAANSAANAAALPIALRHAPDPATASPRELRVLPGIGEARAIAIAEARWRLPPGRSLGLGDIAGIGPVTEARVRALLDHAGLRANATQGPSDPLASPTASPARVPPAGASSEPAAEPRDAPDIAPPVAPGIAPDVSPRVLPGVAPGFAPGVAPGVAPGRGRVLPPPLSRAGDGSPRWSAAFSAWGPDRQASRDGLGSGGRVGAVHSFDPFPPTTLGHPRISPDRRAAGAEAAHRPP